MIQIVVVPDSSTAQKVPPIEGLLEYRKDNQELYVRSNKAWNMVAQEEKVKLLNQLGL
jgi:ribosomal protein L24E